MARWRLTGPHYLNVPGTEWEYSEVSNTGQQKRIRFPVPTYLDPAAPPTWNDAFGKMTEIVVCHEGKGQRGDITFIGEPTPDMVPLDDEAIAISKNLEETKWKAKVEDIVGSYGDHLERKLEKELSLIREQTQQQSQPVAGMQELLAAMAGMMKQNQDLMALIAAQQVPAEAPKGVARRV